MTDLLTPRAYLVSLGLAKESRGRFSAAAVAALDEAKAKGMTFADPTPVKATPKPKAAKPAGPVAKVKAPKTPKVTSIAKAEVSQQRADAITPLAMPKRKQREGWVIDPSIGGGAVISYTLCARADKGGCGKAVNFCACPTGPLAPHYLPESVALKPLLLDKPVV